MRAILKILLADSYLAALARSAGGRRVYAHECLIFAAPRSVVCSDAFCRSLTNRFLQIHELTCAGLLVFLARVRLPSIGPTGKSEGFAPTGELSPFAIRSLD